MPMVFGNREEAISMKKSIAIGIEDYKEMIDKGYYYIDKTLFLRELLDKGSKVNLFTRPRRFGKTLALSMVRTFFEIDMEFSAVGQDSKHYFQGMKILQEGEKYTQHMAKYPVVCISLKSAKQPEFEMAYISLQDEIVREYERHSYILERDALSASNQEKYRSIMEGKAEYVTYAKSLYFLMSCLKKYHKKNVILLIDEYDVPLENAYLRGFYDRMADFIRSLFESALKTNEDLEFAMITGCLRISKESIFTGLNNLKVFSLLNYNFAEYFGFTESEVFQMLDFYEICGKKEELKRWYDGYQFGDIEVYNPWSVINYVDDIVNQNDCFPKPYWSNTSSNSIVRELVDSADAGMKHEIEGLIAGGYIEKPIFEDTTYTDIHKTQDNLWNFLFFTGYLKAVEKRFLMGTIYVVMAIPNEEIRYIYRNTIHEWFQKKIKVTDFTPFYRAIFEGDSGKMEQIIKKHLMESISYYDSAEAFYHGFLLGLLSTLQDCEVASNQESGDGRPDIMLKPYDEQQFAIILELKRASRYTQMDGLCEAALTQIIEKNYQAELLDEGYTKIRSYGICFCKKSCMVKMA